jgi:hypothetical protein
MAECLVSRYVLGWEVRYKVDGELLRSEVFRTQDAMPVNVEHRKAEFESKGWVEPMDVDSEPAFEVSMSPHTLT